MSKGLQGWWDAGENAPVRNALWQVAVRRQFLKHKLCLTMLEALGPLGGDGESRAKPQSCPHREVNISEQTPFFGNNDGQRNVVALVIQPWTHV